MDHGPNGRHRARFRVRQPVYRLADLGMSLDSGWGHPHDGGDRLHEPDTTTFPGVRYNRPGDTGDFGLNQGIWTTMSYNDGWTDAPGVYPSYGYQGTPMAFDIAALQELYG